MYVSGRCPLYTCSIIYKYFTFNTPDENDERSRRETVEEQSRRMQIAIQVVYNLCVMTIFRNIYRYLVCVHLLVEFFGAGHIS